ncbi:hypothetical protein MAR_033324, partial [Mya arenaria]
ETNVMNIIRANVHQGHRSFKGNGRQCVANALVSILEGYKYPPRLWKTDDLNDILHKGDALYLSLVAENSVTYLNIDDIPPNVATVSGCLHGTLCGGTSEPFYSLHDAVNLLMGKHIMTGCLLTVGNTEPCYSTSILKNDDSYFLFDSHSRGDNGMLCVDGSACLTQHPDTSTLCTFIQHLAGSLHLEPSVPFELAAMTLPSNQQISDPNFDSSDSNSTFSYFDPVSDGEYTCKLFMANEVITKAHNDILKLSESDSGDNDCGITDAGDVGRSRKRKRDVTKWKRNIAKQRRNEVVMTVKTCFTTSGSSQMLTSKGISSKCTQSKGQKSSDEVSKIRVCKTFFLGTLGISDKMVGTVHKKMNSLGICLDDKRGSHHNRPNKISEQTLEQNKNRYYVAMLWYCLGKYNLHSITHKYLEKGHTQNEGDAIHSSIENASRHVPVYTTSQWATLVRSARNKNPYIVTEMTLRDFYDFKGLAGNVKNFEVTTDSQKVIWNSIKILQLNSAKQHQFQYQTDYEGDTFTVDLFYRSRHSIPKPGNIPLQQLRSQSVPIPKLKYMDLVGLCQSNIIPRAHHAFYLILPHADK